MTYLRHVTLNTDHVARQWRRDISDSAIDALSETLDGMMQGARMPVPGQPGYLITGSHSGHNLITTLWRGPWLDRVPILTTATALKSRGSPALWRLIHDRATLPLATDSEVAPRAPWQADRLEIGSLMDPAALAWSGDLSRCIAWSWLEYRS